MVLSLDTCEFVATTLDGAPFGFSPGASAIASSAGCGYGAHGETTFSRTTIDFNSQTWSQTFYELRGVEWTEYTTQTGTGVQAPSDSWDDCGGATVN